MIEIFPVMQQVNELFYVYADALERFDAKAMAFLYQPPCILLSDDATTVFNEYSKLEGFFNQGVSFYRQFGIANVKQEIWSKHNWTGKIVKVKVRWKYADINTTPIYNCDYEYVLKTDKNNHLKIVMSISLNEREKMEEWQKMKKSTK